MVEERITEIIKDTIERLGFELVKVSLTGPNSKVLEILIDRIDQLKVSIDDCKIVSRNISTLLDIEEIIKDKYYLEVASCGVERPLIKPDDYKKFIGREAKIKLQELMNGVGSYQGKIINVEEGLIKMNFEGKLISIPFQLIKKARLVFTDEMFREALNKSK